ncbi:PfkB family carbohydrate kinase [Ruania rhizosphaerae]|uniref:PfkB family carbohydrate kinase n=1 Tax=Ruania rhizosphaerae TaxID=1840413 RepID=UPI00135B98F1|nr:PfkB family carbohydrate kinase [Ruania rhizosphaerae]
MTTSTAVCCGLTTLDITQVVTSPPTANEKIVASDVRVAVGGPAANAALTAAALGSPAVLVTALGTGPLADLARSELTGCGVQVLDVGTIDAPPVSTVLVTAATGERAVVSTNFTAARPLPASAGLEQIPDGAGCVLVDGHLPEASLILCAAARVRGVPTLMDGGSYKPAAVGLLAALDAVLLSEDFMWPGTGDPIAAVAAHGPELVGQSSGAGPIRVLGPDGRAEVPVPAVPTAEVVDTLGAGDVLHGAWAHAIATGGDVTGTDVLRAAAEVASLSVRYPGALGWAREMQSRSG